MSTRTPTPLPTRIGHILVKDLRLFGWLALVVACLQGLLKLLTFRDLPFDADDSRSAAVVMLALVIAMVLAVVAVIHAEAPASDRQDWLVRPIQRRDLLLAKSAWVALVIHAPIFLANLAECLAHGFAFWPSVTANLWSAVSIAVLFTLPFMALAAITRTLLQALGAALLGFVVVLVLIQVLPDSTSDTGTRWVLEDVSHTVASASFIGVLLLQYARRATANAWALFVAGLLVAVLITALPWRLAAGFERAVAPADRAAAPTVTFAADRSPLLLPGARPLAGSHHRGPSDDLGSSSDVLIGIPLRFDALPADQILHSDRIRVRAYAGQRLLLDRPGIAFDLPPGADRLVRQDLRLTTRELRLLSAQPVRIEIRYAFTALRLRGPAASLGLNERATLAGGLQCATHRRDAANVEVGCRALIEVPDCIGFELADGGGPQSEAYACAPSHEPAALRFSAEPLDSVTRTLALRPGPGGAQVQVRTYAPERSWDARVVIPSVELKALRLVP